MEISITDPGFNTLMFGICFFALLAISTRIPKFEKFFAPERTQELKGFAILSIIFSHIGYFLVTDHSFLFPFSILAGVGVNLFLFLSGLGLTLSSLKHPLPILKFYRKRLQKLFIPMWFMVITFVILDIFLLGKNYSLTFFWQTALGLFPHADLYQDFNSPLWYFTCILFYYLLFPLFFYKKLPYLAPVLLLAAGYLILKQPLPIADGVRDLYKTHFAAFPLGVLFAILISDEKLVSLKLKFKEIFLFSNLKYLLIIVFTGLFAYYSYYSGVGESKNVEQTLSLITMFSIIFVFIAKPFEFKLLTLFGIYSYEIYLIHWPILSRYDFLYKYLPAYAATILYLAIFLGLGYLIQKMLERIKI